MHGQNNMVLSFRQTYPLVCLCNLPQTTTTSMRTLDGKHTTHATTMVAYQTKAFGPELPPQSLADHSLKRRSLETPLSTQTIHDFGVRGRRSTTVTSFIGKIQNTGPSFDNNPGIERKDLCLAFAEVKQTQLFSFSQ